VSATGAFEQLFGTSPEGTWVAPGRVNLIGEFTDFNEGHVLPTAQPRLARASAARRGDGCVRVVSAQHPGGAALGEARAESLRPGAVEGWAAYALGVVWSLRESGHDVGGADILLDSEVPIGAGLSSSAAIECAVGLALRELYALDLTLPQLAQVAQHAENAFVGMPCGVMDQMASLLCVPDHALLLDTRTLDTEQLPLGLRDAGLALAVLDTRVRHDLAESAYGERRAACELAAARRGVPALRDLALDDLDAAVAQLADPVLVRRVRHVVTEEARVLEVAALLRAGRVADIGPALSAGHESLRYDFEVSCAELDLAVETAMAVGALGARMVGGGFGGSAIALVEAGRRAELERAVSEAFARAGYDCPRVLVVAPSPVPGGE
jgi:galactokinase